MRLASARSYALLSVAAALITIALKTLAWSVTGSVGLLSDALESSVNLVAALTAFWALGQASKPADRNHSFGHSKAEYFSRPGERPDRCGRNRNYLGRCWPIAPSRTD